MSSSRTAAAPRDPSQMIASRIAAAASARRSGAFRVTTVQTRRDGRTNASSGSRRSKAWTSASKCGGVAASRPAQHRKPMRCTRRFMVRRARLAGVAELDERIVDGRADVTESSSPCAPG